MTTVARTLLLFGALVMMPKLGRSDTCIDISSSGCDGSDQSYFDNAELDPNTPPPPVDGNGLAWTAVAYVDGSNWTAAHYQWINNGVALVPVAQPRNSYCPYYSTGGGGPSYADWIGPVFTGPTAPIPGVTPVTYFPPYNNGDRWWDRHRFTLPPNAQVTSAVLSYSADNEAIPTVDGLTLPGAPGPGLGWGSVYTYTVPLDVFAPQARPVCRGANGSEA